MPNGLTIGTAGGNKVVDTIHIGTAGGNKAVTEGWVGTASGNKLFYAGITVTIDSIGPWVFDSGTGGYFADGTYSASGGTAPYPSATVNPAGPTLGASATGGLFSILAATNAPLDFTITVTDSVGSQGTSATATVNP